MAKSKKLADEKIERFSQTLKVALTTEEIADRADRAAAALADRDAKASELKASVKNAKSVIEEIESRLRLLSCEVRTRSTYRAVECERRFDYTTGRVTDTRTDTGEVIGERNLTFAEKQRELPFVEKENATQGEEDEAVNSAE